MGVASALPALGTAAYLWIYSGRIIRSGRCPPPGSRVVRDTEVSRGSRALKYARGLQIIAIVMAAAAVLLGYFLWRAWDLLTKT